MIHDVKDDPILQDPSQEPSLSSKYGLQGQGFLTLPNYAREMKFCILHFAKNPLDVKSEKNTLKVPLHLFFIKGASQVNW